MSTVYEMYKNCGSAEDSLDNLLVIASGLICLTKLITYHIHRDKLRANVISAINDWSFSQTTDNRSIMKNYEKMYKRITFSLLTAVTWCGCLYFLKVIVIDPDTMIAVLNPLTNNTHLVVKKRYLFPWTCSMNNVTESVHLLLVLNQFIQMLTCCVIAVGSDAFFVAITTHLCAQFEILKIRFSRIGNVNGPIKTDDHEELALLISRHQHLLKLCEFIEGAYNKIVFTQLLASVTLISIAGNISVSHIVP